MDVYSRLDQASPHGLPYSFIRDATQVANSQPKAGKACPKRIHSVVVRFGLDRNDSIGLASQRYEPKGAFGIVPALGKT